MKIQVWYAADTDIMCIVEGNKLYKYIGDMSEEILLQSYDLNDWYEAQIPPHPEFFDLIGEL